MLMVQSNALCAHKIMKLLFKWGDNAMKMLLFVLELLMRHMVVIRSI